MDSVPQKQAGDPFHPGRAGENPGISGGHLRQNPGVGRIMFIQAHGAPPGYPGIIRNPAANPPDWGGAFFCGVPFRKDRLRVKDAQKREADRNRRDHRKIADGRSPYKRRPAFITK